MLVQNVVAIFFQNSDAIVLRRILVDRDALHSVRRRHKDVPLAVFFHKLQEVILIIDLELQFACPSFKLDPSGLKSLGMTIV